MKKHLILFCLAVISMTAQAQVQTTDKGVTFVVDENLPAPKKRFRSHIENSDWNAEFLLQDYRSTKNGNGYITSSFKNDSPFSLLSNKKDVLFRCIVKAYAEHRPLTLSPDMIWLNISQVFGHYANEHAEELRNKIVSHNGKIDLAVQSEEDLLSGKADWAKLTDNLVKQIGKNTKSNLAKTITADFSTTGEAERIASGVTLMNATSSYFEYVIIYIACGIPNITLTGTPKDWEKVLDKTKALDRYGMKWYTKELEPILKEFIAASKGKPNRAFWKNMVMQDRPDRLRGDACSKTNPTVFDGWFLKFFPYDKDGKRIQTVTTLTEMLPGMVKADFRYIVTDGIRHQETPMELWAGFIGVVEDSATLGLTPKIGWIVNKADTEEDILGSMKKKDFLMLRVKEVPPILSQLKKVKTLILYFTDKVVLPDWMDDMQIENFTIHGTMSEQEEGRIKERFPHIVIHHSHTK